MKHTTVALLAFCFIIASCTSSGDNPTREEILFDSHWKFMRADVAGAEQSTFDDSSWRLLNLPHDYSIEDIPGTDSPFDPKAITAVNGGFITNGTAWYRKSFDIPADWKCKTLELLFEGVYMNADVWVNGTHMGNNIYGYTPFHFDITDHVKLGEKNVVAVQVKNEGNNSRWYTGSGIYRHVWLKALPAAHIAENGVYITTPDIAGNNATVHVATQVMNKSVKDESVTLQTEIIDPFGNVVASTETKQTLLVGASHTFSQQFSVKQPQCWSPDSPSLYVARTKLISANESDLKTTTFGIRTITMDAKNGFVLNGIPMKLKGGCIHHDNGPLGSKAFDRAEIRKVELLKANGYNSVRCAHNPPTVAFLDACDRLGLLVIDEAYDMWKYGKNPQDYHLYFNEDWQNSLGAMIRRDRNHPSIFVWSTGNEIPGMSSPEIVEISRQLKNFVHSIDPTRPITAGVNGLDDKRKDFFSTLDIVGLNYAIWPNHDYYAKLSKDYPDMIMYGSESYALDAFDAWAAVEKYPFVIGDYIWTAIDYIGEASIGWHGYPQKTNFYPWNLAFDGDIDICGWKRPQSYYRDSFWNKDNVTIAVHPPVSSFEPQQKGMEDWSRWHYEDIVFDWNWEGHEGKKVDVDVYASCEETELFINNKSLGKKKAGPQNKNKTTYQVPYEKGELKAIGYDKNGKVVENRLITSGPATQIKLTADRTAILADGQDLSYVTIELQDANGILNPKAENQLQFSLDGGDATIVAVGNANPVSVESYTQPTRKAWRGKCLVIIRAGEKQGPVMLKVNCPGLPEASIKVDVVKL